MNFKKKKKIRIKKWPKDLDRKSKTEFNTAYHTPAVFLIMN